MSLLAKIDNFLKDPGLKKEKVTRSDFINDIIIVISPASVSAFLFLILIIFVFQRSGMLTHSRDLLILILHLQYLHC